MKYKLLKKFDSDSVDVGTILEIGEYTRMNNGKTIRTERLVEQGYLLDITKIEKLELCHGDNIHDCPDHIISIEEKINQIIDLINNKDIDD